MSRIVPILFQKDLESVALTRTRYGFGLKAFHALQNKDVSLKLLTTKNATERDLKMLLQEVADTQCIQSVRLLSPIGICQLQGLFGVVTEWMHNGSLHALIHEHELYPELPFPLCIRILSDVAEGLRYLHHLEPPILHHRLKPSNILLDLEYRAKISDYGLTTWRRQQLQSVLQSCNNRSCWDLLYLSPEILQGGSFSREGDIYSFGMVCWEILSRQTPLKGAKTLLKAVMGVCSGMRPGIEPEYIPNSLPYRNKLLQLTILCWHQEPGYRPHAEECTELLQDILGTFRKEMISDAIYGLIHAKDCAIAAAKGPVDHTLKTDMQNLEVICPQNYKPNKTVTLKAQSLTSAAGEPEKDVKQKMLAENIPDNTASERGPPFGGSKGSNPLNSITTTPSQSRKGTIPNYRGSEGGQQKVTQPLVHGPNHNTSCSNFLSIWPDHTLTGPYFKERCCAILTYSRATILGRMTEGRLNNLLDILRSQRLLSRMDYETITSFPTLTSRARALLDTCLELGEEAAQTVVAVLSANKHSPLAQGIPENAVN
ncbi:receptor-interacting serine/threonine-protein kinase 2-like [Tiliqua scincoides]|uniref:receptor-interacting serine/threonine-protein kinase 2-like n=1 Tax=Tiliqua scincoides TaxID=71010 RepID=UPI003462A0E7